MKNKGPSAFSVYWILLAVSAFHIQPFGPTEGPLPPTPVNNLSYSMRSKSTSGSASDVVKTTAHPAQDDVDGLTYMGDIEEDSDRCDPIQQALLAEQEENRRLREESQQFREQNSVLINRLKNLGQSTALSPADSELLVPEISRELLDNLVRENLRIKRELQSKSSTSHLTSQIEEMDQLRQEKARLTEHLRQVQSLRTASTDEKDAEISRLAGELEAAKAEISELAAQCRQLVQQQDENKKTSYLTDNIQKMSLQNGNDEIQQLKRQNDELRGEVQQVRLQFQEVVQSNTQWQTYDQQREEHMKRLSAEKQELELKLARGGGNVSPQHNQDLYKRLQESENERQHLVECNRGLEMRVQQLERAIGSTQEERERVLALENQVQVFSEDFRQERKDREKAQARAAALEEDNGLLRQQLEQFQTSHMAFLSQRRADTMDRYRAEYERQRGRQSGFGMRNNLVSHGPYGQVVADGSDDDEDILDVPMSQAVRGNTDNNSSNGSLPPQQSSLECPKCHQQFPVDDPMQFLEHNDQCNS